MLRLTPLAPHTRYAGRRECSTAMVTADTDTLDPFPIDGLGLGLSVWLGLGLGLGVRLSTRVVHLKNDYEVELRDEPQTPPDEVPPPVRTRPAPA